MLNNFARPHWSHPITFTLEDAKKIPDTLHQKAYNTIKFPTETPKDTIKTPKTPNSKHHFICTKS